MDSEKQKSKKWLVVIIIVFVIIVAFLVVGYFVTRPSGSTAETSNGEITQIVQADWIDLTHIGSISKFRSGSGHDFSGNGETCRSMKHYFNALRTREDQEIVDQYKGFPPFSLEGAIAIFSPVDGEIIEVQGEDSEIGKQIYIRSSANSDYTFRLFHIFLLDGFKKGTKVKAGDKIGNIGRIQNTDIAVAKGSARSSNFVSYFELMPDEIFAKYQALGIKSRDELIISKEYRDANPLKCNGEQFAENYDDSSNPNNLENFVFINGYHP